MASGSPPSSRMPQYASEIPVSMLVTPLWYTASPLALPSTSWQQISNTHYAAHTGHTPSNFTPLNTSTSGIFQYNSAPPPKIHPENAWTTNTTSIQVAGSSGIFFFWLAITNDSLLIRGEQWRPYRYMLIFPILSLRQQRRLVRRVPEWFPLAGSHAVQKAVYRQ